MAILTGGPDPSGPGVTGNGIVIPGVAHPGVLGIAAVVAPGGAPGTVAVGVKGDGGSGFPGIPGGLPPFEIFGVGVQGVTADPNGHGVWGQHTANAAGGGHGVFGQGTGGAGVFGTSVNGPGILGSSTNGNAGEFSGNVKVTGDLSVSGISFNFKMSELDLEISGLRAQVSLLQAEIALLNKK